MGQSAGHWEGDALVVDVTGLDERTWFDRSGNYHSDTDILWYEATIEDPKVFLRPWKISMPLYRHVEKDAQLLDFADVREVRQENRQVDRRQRSG